MPRVEPLHGVNHCAFRAALLPFGSKLAPYRGDATYSHSVGVNGLEGIDLAFPPSPSSVGRACGLKDSVPSKDIIECAHAPISVLLERSRNRRISAANN